MITDARVLEEEFVPKDIVHRHTEMNLVSEALNPVTKGETAENVYLFDPSGAGKTTVARYSLQKLSDVVVGLPSGYVNCWCDHSEYTVLFQAIQKLVNPGRVHRESTARDELLRILRQKIDQPAVLVLDEVDQLDNPDVLYDLHSIGPLSLILIANREAELFAHLDERIVSRLRAGYRVTFDKCDHDALVDALADVEGNWICSYSDLPDGLEDHHVVGRDENHFMGNGKKGSTKSARERLVMNFEPTEA